MQADSPPSVSEIILQSSRLHLFFLLQCQQRLHVECTFKALFLNLTADFIRLSYIAVE